jgi:hypothetical protein
MSKPGKSLISFTVVTRIQALISTANGAFVLPEREPGKEYPDRKARAKARAGDYFQGLLNKTPVKPQLEVLAIKKERVGSHIYVLISNAKGEKVGDFTIKGEITEENAAATGASIAKIFKSPQEAGVCARRLLELARSQENETVAFRIAGDNKQPHLQIETTKDGA